MSIAYKDFNRPRVAQEALFDSLFRRLGTDGVYARSGRYEAIIEALGSMISRHRDADAEVLRFPPVVSRALIEKSGYLKSFPHLLGCVCGLTGDERTIVGAVERFMAGGTWTDDLTASDLVLAPAACYPVYPLAAEAGPVPDAGLIFDVACDCFRREPSTDIDRFQSFRMREFVRIALPDQVRAFREAWMPRACGIAETLGLPYRVEAASDPFFGRGGTLVGKAQLQMELKFELLVPVRSAERPTACMSFNYHRDHFGATWGLRDKAGETCHTGCIAFGLDRLAVALFANHGIEPKTWPAATREALGL